MKNTFKNKPKLKDIADFLIHNIRKLKIRDAFEKGGLKEA